MKKTPSVCLGPRPDLNREVILDCTRMGPNFSKPLNVTVGVSGAAPEPITLPAIDPVASQTDLDALKREVRGIAERSRALSEMENREKALIARVKALEARIDKLVNWTQSFKKSLTQKRRSRQA